MEIRKTNVHLAYKIEEKPDGGFIARSDDPGVESIEAPTKAELFEKMRAKTAELIGREIPLGIDPMKTTDLNIGGANIHIDRRINVNVIHRNNSPEPKSNWVSNTDARVPSERSVFDNMWKILLLVFLGLVIGWYFLRGF